MFNNSITSATDDEVMALVGRMAEINGNSFIDRAVFPPALLEAGRSLIVALGGTVEQARELTDKELQSFYSVTRKGGAFSGRSLIAKRFKAPRPVPTVIHAASAPTIAQAAPIPDSIRDDIKSLRYDVNALADSAIKSDCAIASIEARLDSLNTARPVQIQVNELPAVTFEVSHPNLPRLIREIADGDDVWLVGDRGSGKSVAARQVAKALGVPCHIMTGAGDKTDIVGYKFNGEIKSTPFRDCWINGGVLLMDEMDTWDAQALIVVNDALSNGRCTFDDGAFDRSPKCYIMAATNTDGRGGNTIYSARSVIDGSTRDRFCYIPWPYVPEMETKLGALNPAWTSYVQAVRAAMASMSMDETPSPRASIKGGKSIFRGASWQEAAESWIFKGMNADYQRRINNAVPMADYQAQCPVTLL